MSSVNPTEFVLYLAAGATLGAAYFTMLFWTVRLYTSQARTLRVLPLYVLRLAAAATVFWLIAQQGAVPLLAALLGFLMARGAAQRWLKAE